MHVVKAHKRPHLSGLYFSTCILTSPTFLCNRNLPFLYKGFDILTLQYSDIHSTPYYLPNLPLGSTYQDVLPPRSPSPEIQIPRLRHRSEEQPLRPFREALQTRSQQKHSASHPSRSNHALYYLFSRTTHSPIIQSIAYNARGKARESAQLRIFFTCTSASKHGQGNR